MGVFLSLFRAYLNFIHQTIILAYFETIDLTTRFTSIPRDLIEINSMYDSEGSFDLTCNDMRDAFYFIINKICIYINIRKFVMHFISYCSKLRVHVQSIRIPMSTTCAPLSIELQGRRRRSGRTASAGTLFLDKYAFRRVPFFSFWLIFLCAYL